MATQFTRKELKQDTVAAGVGKSIHFAEQHRGLIVKILGALLTLIVIVAVVVYYRNSQRDVRQAMLGEAITAQNAPESPGKKDAVTKAYQKLFTEHGGSDEGYIAEYTLATMDAEAGRSDEARRKFQNVIDHANRNYASLAKLSLAQLQLATGRETEARTLLNDLMANPTDLVSKNQASYTLARGISKTKPEEARKLLTPLVTSGTEVGQTAMQALSDLPPK